MQNYKILGKEYDKDTYFKIIHNMEMSLYFAFKPRNIAILGFDLTGVKNKCRFKAKVTRTDLNSKITAEDLRIPGVFKTSSRIKKEYGYFKDYWNVELTDEFIKEHLDFKLWKNLEELA